MEHPVPCTLFSKLLAHRVLIWTLFYLVMIYQKIENLCQKLGKELDLAKEILCKPWLYMVVRVSNYL
jgi:hypothetical protein